MQRLFHFFVVPGFFDERKITQAEAVAQAAKKGIWRDFVPPKDANGGVAAAAISAASSEPEPTGETAQLLVTEVTDGSCFYCQRVSEEHQKVIFWMNFPFCFFEEKILDS
jgi:hypothetical protein